MKQRPFRNPPCPSTRPSLLQHLSPHQESAEKCSLGHSFMPLRPRLSSIPSLRSKASIFDVTVHFDFSLKLWFPPHPHYCLPQLSLPKRTALPYLAPLIVLLFSFSAMNLLIVSKPPMLLCNGIPQLPSPDQNRTNSGSYHHSG
jgi:hypothetical protein